MGLEALFVLIAGLGAGIITGLFGASAVNFAVPVLIIFLGYNPYLAIGLSLGIDVFSSLSSSIEYYNKRKIKFKSAGTLIFASFIGVALGSYFSVYIPTMKLQWFLGMLICFSGILLAVKKGEFSIHDILKLKRHSRIYKAFVCIFLGILVGLNTGIFGAGGGLLIFSILVMFLNYDIHSSIGTSIFSMVFIAFIGAVIHYIVMPFSLYHLFLGSIAGIIGSYYSAVIANRISGKSLSLITGVIISILGAGMFLKAVLF
ncbi:MAG: sulfite exporter TauE/SafE family protein [Nanoarchaeota archaeon]